MNRIKLLKWQKSFLAKCMAKFRTARDFLCVATPGSGKTFAALATGRAMLDAGMIEQIIVVVPSVPLTEQWTEEAHKHFGLDFEPNGSPERHRKYDGVVITYHTLANAALNYRAMASGPVLVILDEIHHADREDGWWGKQLVEAFRGDRFYRLALSGTPFRTKGEIVFLHYDETRPGWHKAVADFYYGVGESIRDEKCRRICFPTIEVPHIEWRRGEHTFSASLSDSLSEEQERDRNFVALDAGSAAVRLLLEQAHAKLLEIRRTHHDAAALLLAANHNHAKLLKEVLRNIIGQEPVYLCDETEAITAIRRFKKSAEPWIVAVRKISEGTDIPRLRVLAFLTNIETQVFFRQAVGRVVRRIKDIAPQDAFVYMLAREPFLTFAAELEKEQETEISVEDEDDEKNQTEGSDEEPQDPAERASLVSCDAHVGATILTGGAAPLVQEELDASQYLIDKYNIPASAIEVALDLRDARTPLDNPLPPRPAEPKAARIKRKLARIQQLANAVGLRRGYPKEEAAKRIHLEWKQVPGNSWHNEMDEGEMDRKIVWLQNALHRSQAA